MPPPIKLLLIAAAYLLTGKLGLLLAIPPGYATAVWPPSGIALGALLLLGKRYWPGVWLGSFLTNLTTSLDSSDSAAIAQSLTLCGAIGAGAALQAALGVGLVQRFIGLPTTLSRERQILLFFVLGGPVACLVNATVGVGSLWATGAIPAGAIAFSWWTWWVGDTIGAMIFAPLVLMWLGGGAWRRRRGFVTFPLMATFAAAVVVFVYSSRLESEQLEQRFHADAEEFAGALMRRLDLNTELLRATGGLFTASRQVEREEFRAFARVMLSERADLIALEWVPRVRAAERAAFEHLILPLQSVPHGIFERDPNFKPVRAGARAEYYPVRYLVPDVGNDGVRGFDLASETKRRTALEAARDSARVSLTAPLNLLQSEHIRDGLLLVLPVYTTPSPPATLAERRVKLSGFVVAVIRTESLVNLVLAERPVGESLHVRIADIGSLAGPATAPQIFYRDATAAADSDGTQPPARNALHYRLVREVAGRHWALDFYPTLEYLTLHTSLLSWLVLTAGMLFSAIIGAGALVVTGRTVAVEAQVRERTAELARINERLAQANRVKTEFISTVSHELRTPLTSIRGSLGLVAGGAVGALPEKAQQLIEIAYRNTDRLALLIDDILDIERIESGQLSMQIARHSLPELIEQAVVTNRGYARRCNVRFVLRRSLPYASAMVDPRRFSQVMANLLSNAAKFSPAGSSVKIGLTVKGGRARVSVSDRGPGIPVDFRGRIFERFSQADGSDSRAKGGTGLGLAISKVLIEQMGGIIDYRSGADGTTFFFDLPLAVDGPGGTRQPELPLCTPGKPA